MATAYGSTVGNAWRAYMDYSVTDDNEKYIVSITSAGIQSVNYGLIMNGIYHSIGYNSGSGETSWGNQSTNSFSSSYGETKKGSFNIAENKEFKREHYDYSVYIYSYVRFNNADVNAGYGYLNGSSQAEYHFTVPAKPSYTVTFNANGGHGAPSAQTKWYGEPLPLSSTKPTRANYNFLGWATSSSGSVAYNAGASYTANSAITLYAVWQVAYTAPRITSVQANRCDSNGVDNDFGTSVRVRCNWACDKSNPSIVVAYRASGSSSWTNARTITGSGTSGSVDVVIGGNLSTDSKYEIRITVTDSGGSNYMVADVLSGKFVLDFKSGGGGVAIGKASEENCFEVGFDSKFYNNMYKVSGGVNMPVTGYRVLYDNSSGNGGAVTLSDSAANFTFIDIYFQNNNLSEFNCVRVYSPNGKKPCLTLTEAVRDDAGLYILLRSTYYTISGTSITPDSYNCGYCRVRSDGAGVSGSAGANYIKIVQVVGYK